MGDVVNLNQFRKKRDRAAKAQQRAANRARTGRTKAERQATQAEAVRGAMARSTASGSIMSPTSPRAAADWAHRATERRVGIAFRRCPVE